MKNNHQNQSFFNSCISAVKRWYFYEKKLIFLSCGLGLMSAIIFAFITNSYSESIQQGIAGEVVRFHVLANSDSEYDQSLKLKVRDGVLAAMQPALEKTVTLEDTIAVLNDNLDTINQTAAEIITENNANYSVNTQITKSFFPSKTYGDVSFPAGEYTALQIVIGDGGGKNWWCVMFPPLCYVDVTVAGSDTTVKNELKNILTDEEYDIVLSSQAQNKDIPVKVKFKIVEWWQELKNIKLWG